MSGIRSESLVIVSPEVSQAVSLRSRRGCLVAVVKSRPRGRGCAGRPSLVKPGGSSGGKRPFPRGGSMHDSCPDCAGTQPKRTIIPVYPKLQSVIEWPGPVTCDASLTPGRPSGCAPGERGAGTRRCTGADGAAGVPGRGGLAGADGGAGTGTRRVGRGGRGSG